MVSLACERYFARARNYWMISEQEREDLLALGEHCYGTTADGEVFMIVTSPTPGEGYLQPSIFGAEEPVSDVHDLQAAVGMTIFMLIQLGMQSGTDLDLILHGPEPERN
jgi:hypothetical protein